MEKPRQRDLSNSLKDCHKARNSLPEKETSISFQCLLPAKWLPQGLSSPGPCSQTLPHCVPLQLAGLTMQLETSVPSPASWWERTPSYPILSHPIPSHPILFIIILSRSNSSKSVSKVSCEVVLNCPISPRVILDWIIRSKTFHPNSQRMHCYSNILVEEEYCDLWARFWKVLSAVEPQRNHLSPLFPTSFKERAWMAQEAGSALRSLTTRHPWLKSSTDDD